MADILKIERLYNTLSAAEKQQLLSDLKLVKEEQSEIEVHACPYCGHEEFNKFGQYKRTNMHRYRCKSCKRTFLPTTGTLLHYINKRDKFFEYAQIMKTERLRSISYMTKRLQISTLTAFDWRHKLLLSIPEDNKNLSGEVQCDDIWFLYSQKGRKGLKYARKRGGSKRRGDNNFQAKIITATDKKQVKMNLARIGRITKDDLMRVLADKLSEKASLISDGHRSYAAFAQEMQITHHIFIAKLHKNNAGKNMQLINNMAERLKTLVNRILRGVSTKYLQLYANYFAYSEKHEFNASNDSFLSNNKVWRTFVSMEAIYAEFIKNYSMRTYRCPVKREWKLAIRSPLMMQNVV